MVRALHCFAAILIACCLTSCTSSEAPKSPPDHRYDYYSGGEEYGNHFCKVQSFTHTDSGKTVTLIGMIHTADQQFYENVDAILDKHDIVLEEGIYGLPSFGIHKYFSQYIFFTMTRFNYLQKLSAQGHHLKDRENTVLADMSSDEFASQGSIFTPLIQLVSIPVMITFTEPYYLYEKGKQKTYGLFSDEAEREATAELRHLTLSNLELADKPSETFLPGIINKRNTILIEELNRQLKKESVNTIAIPWGASHLPSLETDLLKSGFTKNNTHSWLQTIAVKDYLDNPDKYGSNSDYFGIPYIFETEVTPKVMSNSMIFASVKNIKGRDFNRFSLVYGDLTDYIETENYSYFSILPRISGKPILFDYLNKNGKKRFRFLWFFKIGKSS